MDESLTREYLASSKYVPEKTSYLELTSFKCSGVDDMIAEGDLEGCQIADWICQKGQFKPCSTDTRSAFSLRLLMQESIDPRAFERGSITFPTSCWLMALEKNIIISQMFELATCPGLVLWTNLDLRNERKVLDIILQWRCSKLAERKLVLSLTHCLETSRTTGYYKWTAQPENSPDSKPTAIINLLKASISQISNPFLLPIIILNAELDHIEDRQRSIRRQVRKIEDALGLRDGLQAGWNPFRWAEGVVDFEMLNREIVETSAQLQKRKPAKYLEILRELENAMEEFDAAKGVKRQEGGESERPRRECELRSRVRLQIQRIKAMERYFVVTKERLNAQINALYNLIAQKDNKLNYLVSIESRRIAAASKYESSAMRTISILGVVFLPGTFVASVLSTSFFDFQAGSMSPKFWIYLAITVPLTLVVLATWLYWYHSNKRAHEATDRGLEERMPSAAMRRVGSAFPFDRRNGKEM